MANVEARINIKGKRFEILVDSALAQKMKKGENVTIQEVLQADTIFKDAKKGERASEDDLKSALGTDDVYEAAKKIIMGGDIQVPMEDRKKEQEGKIKQVIDFLSKNAVDPATGRPHTPERVERALSEAGVNIQNKPIEQQIGEIVDKIKVILPLKMETKKLKLTIPASYTGLVYGLINNYKEKEEWKDDGSLLVIVKVPIGMQMDFYDKLNSMTHGSTVSEEMKG